jgi:hypothetical protein
MTLSTDRGALQARFTTDLTKDQLASAPAFDFGKLK